jgi:O-antigen ligase
MPLVSPRRAEESSNYGRNAHTVMHPLENGSERRTSLAVALLLIAVTSSSNVTISKGFGTFGLAIALLLGCLWGMSVVFREPARRLHPFLILSLAFLLWGAFTYTYTADQAAGIMRLRMLTRNVLTACILWDLLRSARLCRFAIQAYVLGAFVCVCFLVRSYFTGSVEDADMGRYTALGNNYNEAGVQLALGIPMAWYLTLSSQSGATFWPVMNASYPAFALCGIALTGSRTGILATVPGIALLVVSVRQLRRKVAAVAAITAVLCSMAALHINFERAKDRFSHIHTAARTDRFSARLDIWQETAKVITGHPLLGVGIGGLQPYIARYLKESAVAHNTFLSVCAEQGLVGLLLFGGLIIVALRTGVQTTMRMRVCLLVLFSEWVIGASALTWESAGATWFVMLVLVACGAVPDSRMHSVSIANQREIIAREWVPPRVAD